MTNINQLLGMKIPRYWYDWNEDLRPEQREFPKKSMPFNEFFLIPFV